jgi:hypothetical protein
MSTPELKQSYDLTKEDFERFPVWIGVHNNDIDEPWYDKSDEQTYRPWTGPLRFEKRSQFPALNVAAKFELADTSPFPGYFKPASRKWDDPIPGRKLADGSHTEPKRWSDRRGGSPLSVLSLLSPVIFIAERAFDFHLRRRPEDRKRSVQEFYAAIGKLPSEVFPVRFSADQEYIDGILEGRLDGFYSFPLDRPYEIDTGESFL